MIPGRGTFLLLGEILLERAACRQHAVAEAERHDAIELGHRFGDVRQDVGRNRDFTQRNGLHTHLLGERVAHCYAPWDLPGACARFLDRAQPALAVIMETELWPNLFAACAARGVPVRLVAPAMEPGVEEALRERAEAFEQADKLKGQFVENVSYQLRTPLNAMMGFAEVLPESGPR